MSDSSHGDEARRALAQKLDRWAEQYGAAFGMVLSLSGEEIATVRAALRAEPVRAVEEKEPSPGLLMSMALRYDHGLGMPGYYDQQMFSLSGAATHAQRLESTLSTMRQLWEEVTGNGFYRPEKEAEYAARLAKSRRALDQGKGQGGGDG